MCYAVNYSWFKEKKKENQSEKKIRRKEIGIKECSINSFFFLFSLFQFISIVCVLNIQNNCVN